MALDFRRVRQLYLEFFDRAERKRRWNLETDVDWSGIATEVPDHVVNLAETFYCVESYLPDYTRFLMDMVRGTRGRAWFHAMWAYEESKHSLAFETWLTRAGHRSDDQMDDVADMVLSRQWTPPWETARQMAVYQCIQEAETWMVYKNFARLADETGDRALAQILRLLMVDEREHHNFFRSLILLEMEGDAQGTLEDFYLVASKFRMPAHDLIPDWQAREKDILGEGLTGNMAFMREVWKPLCQQLGVPIRPKERKKILAVG